MRAKCLNCGTILDHWSKGETCPTCFGIEFKKISIDSISKSKKRHKHSKKIRSILSSIDLDVGTRTTKSGTKIDPPDPAVSDKKKSHVTQPSYRTYRPPKISKSHNLKAIKLSAIFAILIMVSLLYLIYWPKYILKYAPTLKYYGNLGTIIEIWLFALILCTISLIIERGLNIDSGESAHTLVKFLIHLSFITIGFCIAAFAISYFLLSRNWALGLKLGLAISGVFIFYHLFLSLYLIFND